MKPEKYFDNLRKDLLKNYKPGMESQMAMEIAGKINNAVPDDSIKVTYNKNRVTVSSQDLTRADKYGVVDLKEAFKQSPKAKKTEQGGWYLIVPIRRYTSSSKRHQASGMPNRMYEQLRQVPLLDTERYRDIATDYLYMNRNNEVHDQMFAYSPKSRTITKLHNPNRRNSSQYIAFRTVSNRSAPQSWVLNRNKIYTNTHSANIDALRKAIRDRG